MLKMKKIIDLKSKKVVIEAYFNLIYNRALLIIKVLNLKL